MGRRRREVSRTIDHAFPIFTRNSRSAPHRLTDHLVVWDTVGFRYDRPPQRGQAIGGLSSDERQHGNRRASREAAGPRHRKGEGDQTSPRTASPTSAAPL